MAIIAGIDEAGYGPLLGPMIISATAFQVPDDKADCSLWVLLKDAVSNGLKGKKQRLAVCDSKKLYNAKNGLKPLEDVVFSFLWLKGVKVTSLYHLLKSLSCLETNVLAGYPWYAEKDHPLPLTTYDAILLNYLDLLNSAQQKHHIRFLNARSCVVPVREFNKQVESAGNKSSVLFYHCTKLMAMLWNTADRNVTVIADKQGGRNTYSGLLKKNFPRQQMNIIKETAQISTYEILGASKKMTVSFVEKGETISMAAALASIFSKYLRELFMRLENHYWQQFLPTLKPTAGYYSDAIRFLSEIEHIKKKEAIDDIMVRRLK